MAGLVIPKVECIETTESYGRFVAEPLERGFGITLGNALRRVLLGSLTGAAVTWVEIDGIQHEFSTMPHVKEDTIDFLLNVKALRIRPLARRPGKLMLEVHGEKLVTAADIESSADFEVVNPDLYLLTTDSNKARINIQFSVEMGRGYIPAGSTNGLPIGAIPVDAVFTPVKRASYSVETSSAAENGVREKLIIEVWTDKTISPTEAVTQSAAILIEQLASFRELAKKQTEEGTEMSWQQLLTPEQYEKPLDQLGFSTHTFNSLRRGGIVALGQLLEKSSEGLTSLAGFGAKSQEEVDIVLKSLNLPALPEIKKLTRKGKKSKSKIIPDESI
jgi:DNA-directed RNA polymerase subunit alpha